MPDYPDDADGDALRRVAAAGSDMTRPMDIDFTVAVPDANAARRVAKAAARLGYRVDVEEPDEEEDGGDDWVVYCTRHMLADHDGVIAAQNELNELSRPFGGTCDGWGTGGNAEEA